MIRARAKPKMALPISMTILDRGIVNLRRFALRVARHLGDPHRAEVDWRALPDGAPATVIDIGANEGQFATTIRRRLPQAFLHSFEPLSEPFARLAALASCDPRHEAHHIALSDRIGRATIHTGARTAASSLFAPAEALRLYYPSVTLDHTEEVNVATLDSWAEKRELETPILVKMDVQGSEAAAIRGGERTLQRASAVWTELSLVELYDGQPLFIDVAIELRRLGFELASIRNLTRARDGYHDLQCDALFLPRRRAPT
jgi:FkbM family methyltransferase